MRHSCLAVLALFGSLTAVPSFAQDIFVPPVTTASPGYLFPNDQYQRDRQNTGTSSAGGQQQSAAADETAEIELDAAAVARIEAALAALVPEYHERFRRDGEVSANDWIRQNAFELGQIEAEHMKQLLGLD